MNDPLPSWTEGEARRRILEAVRSMSASASAELVRPEERIAMFDNDGTLWCEKPTYVQALFLVSRWKEMAEQDPERRRTQPYKAAEAWFADVHKHMHEVVEGVCEAYKGISPDQFEDAVRKFFASARHPRFNLPFTELTYRPMRELVEFLRASDFKVFLTTAGGRDFVRAVSEDLYGIPRENVIGSSAALEYRDGRLIRQPSLTQPIDEGPGKPVHIYERTGRSPVLAVGNSDGDIAMLEMGRVGILLHHDDADREYTYDDGAEKALAAAEQRGWVVVSMKSDFARVF